MNRIKLDEFYKDLTPEYILEKKEELSSIENLFQLKDYTELERKFHKIAGSGGSFGLPKISELAHNLEQKIIQNEHSFLTELYNEYKNYLLTLEIEF